ncbi:exonuclease domain-containing protein [Photobacterium damselae]|uniref:exonuclease domain-containing protein n=1 Tax=Photobacterium damselae TaxID=38293 RepID=UPI001EDC994E|nr:exonuclease domain-containing protein [Photobacterium damselae]MCG3815668.1 hypothetical protein [Photobacterium damselae]
MVGFMVRVVVIDTETTGLSSTKGERSVINIAAVVIIEGQITGETSLVHQSRGKKESV